MSARTAVSFEATLRTAARLGPERTFATRMRERVESFLSSGNLSFERNFLFVRPGIAGLVAASIFVQGSGLPGRTGVLVACTIVLPLDAMYGLLIWKRRTYLLRFLSLFCDNALVIASSMFVFMKMGQAGYESDLWLLYISLIVSNSMYYGPLGSLAFTTLWTGTFVFISTQFYDSSTYFAQQLPERLVFFVLTGFVAISLSAELRRRRENLESKTRQTLTMLATIVEARDTDAGMHLRHIQYYSLALALRLGIPEQAAKEIAYAGMIHDVGKAQVPDAILKKPGPLTPEERREIEKHTLWSGAFLSDSEEFVVARDVARYHHERWDGTGYPEGLAGEAIPIAARIVAVADVYDALVSERPYKHAWSRDRAMAEIRGLAGTHLDPAIVEAFSNLFDTNVLRDLDAGMGEVRGDDLHELRPAA